jgi:hypothetical protein
MEHHYRPSFSAAVLPDESQVLRMGSLCIGGITYFGSEAERGETLKDLGISLCAI